MCYLLIWLQTEKQMLMGYAGEKGREMGYAGGRGKGKELLCLVY